jgi:histidine triad (HIT) family protein
VQRHAPPDYDCPFCAFVRGEERPPWNLLDDVVWRDDGTTAWMNPRWWERNPGNVIVVPNAHVKSMFELDGRQAAAVHETARQIALAMTSTYPCEGVTTRQTTGRARTRRSGTTTSMSSPATATTGSTGPTRA